MDISISPLLLQDTSLFPFDCEALLEQNYTSSDAGYYSACSSLSPASSVDSCCLSPPALRRGPAQEASQCFTFDGHAVQGKRQAPSARRNGRTRSRYPGKKRQSASEREKLRMRDLSKALLHVRTYLPPSVAPAGQTLTKIETLRLAIRYISHLSAQLGLSEEALPMMPRSADQLQTHSSQVPLQTEAVDELASLMQSFPTQQFSNLPPYQNPSAGSFGHSSAQDHWVPQQPYAFYGHCYLE